MKVPLMFQISDAEKLLLEKIQAWPRNMSHDMVHYHAGTNTTSVLHCLSQMATSYFEGDPDILRHSQ